jgi:cysteine desulfurase
MVYLDFNATTPVRPEVRDAMIRCLEADFGNPSSQHRFGQAAARAREDSRRRVARAADCEPAEVVFTSGGTEANNLAIRGVVLADRPRGRHVVTAATEHEAVLHTLRALAADGIATTELPVDEHGRIDMESLARAIRSDTVLVSLMAANNETGVIHEIERVGELCRERGVLFHTDAVQYFGKHPFSFARSPVDLVSISSHKIGGPKGVGALLVRKGVFVGPLQTGGSQERRIRPGTENLPGIVGFAQAAEIAQSSLAKEQARLSALRDRLERGVLNIVPDAVVNGSGAPRLANTSNVSFPGVDGHDLLVALDLGGVAVSTGAACHAGAADPSHVILAMGRAREVAAGSIRFSLGWGTTDEEIERALEVLPELVQRLQSTSTSMRGEEPRP